METVMPKYVLQNSLESLFNKNQTIRRIKGEFCKDTAIQELIAKSSLNDSFCISLLVQMALHKRANLPTLIGLLQHYYGDAQQTADAIYIAAVNDLVNYDQKAKMFITIATISPDVQEEIDKYQYPLPMVVEPKKVTNNSENGYLVFSYGSVILKDNHHEDDVCLDHLNRVNKIKLCINERVALFVKNQWRNLDKPKEDETIQDYQARVKAFNKYDKNAKEVIDLLISEDNAFYLTHKYDKRGRVYCQGYYIQYQGTPWNKATIEFANKELI